MTSMSAEHPVVRLERTIPAALSKVYRAWLEPEVLARWLAPGGLEVRHVEVDARVDGHFRVWETDGTSDAGGFLFGRRTYQAFAAYWPHVTGEERVVAPLNSKPKYVASTTLAAPLEWQDTTVLDGDVVEAVRALKREDGGDLLAIGSIRLVRTLLEHDLVDEFRLMIDPLLLGGGKRAFADHGSPRELRLVDCQATTTGAILATYARARG